MESLVQQTLVMARYYSHAALQAIVFARDLFIGMELIVVFKHKLEDSILAPVLKFMVQKNFCQIENQLGFGFFLYL